jgi:hypothetical protein
MEGGGLSETENYVSKYGINIAEFIYFVFHRLY